MDRGGDDQGKAVSKNDYSSSSSKKRQRVHTNSKAVETTAGKAVATVATKRPRRLQSGLLYDDDDGDHDLYNDDETSAAWITVGNPSYARTYIDGIQRRGDNETNHGLSSSRITLFHDPDFVADPDSIEGTITTASRKAVKCWCSPPQPAVLSYSKGTGAVGKLNQPFYCCGNNGNRKCKFFKWAYQPQLTHWYRFGKHNHHTLVLNDTIDYNLCVGLNGGFSAKDLVQGKVGDCWFLSALAVIAERPDLIQRLFPNHHDSVLSDEHDKYGIIQVKLFMDGYWKTITMDTFLPCLLEFQSNDVEAGLKMHQEQEMDRKMLTPLSSCTDVHALSNTSRDIIKETKQFLYHDRQKKGIFSSLSSHSNDSSGIDPIHLNRPVNSNDLAYSKAQNQQLWVQFLEKAYAKIHGSYQSISGGRIAEAFLDLTGSPTLTQRFDDPNFNPKSFWTKLLSYRQQKLPMGCGTDTSQGGLVGMHAYSILDIREIKNVSVEFFKEKLIQGTLGGVSGFTEYDGSVRVLQIRNPHGRGEWKGEFCDNSSAWEELLKHQTSLSDDGSSLERTMQNDGTFWIDYDSFLMGFSNVDVVLAFQGNHAKSFATNFPPKQSPHRCSRAFEVCMIDEQPGMQNGNDSVQLYIMPIQKTKRGASRGRVDRKVSYKLSDIGILIAKQSEDEGTEIVDYTHRIYGKMLGMARVGHIRITLNRQTLKSIVVMPTSFGHPSATDKSMSFALRFVSDAPLMIRELPQVPRMDRVIHRFCINTSQTEGRKHILLDGGDQYQVFLVDHIGLAFFYIHINDEDVLMKKVGVSFSLQVQCRGMVCRTSDGLLQYDKVDGKSPRKKFKAAWRQYTYTSHEVMSRLLMVVVRSGVDYEFRPCDVSCSLNKEKRQLIQETNGIKQYLSKQGSKEPPRSTDGDKYDCCGIFCQVKNEETITEKTHYPFHHQHGFISTASDTKQFDLDLERTIEISRDDAILQQVLEKSRQESAKASKVSCFDTDQQDYNADLELALKLSTNLNKCVATSHKNRFALNKREVINIDECSPSKEMHKLPSVINEVIEIVDDTREEVLDLKGITSNAKTPQGRKNEVIEIHDD